MAPVVIEMDGARGADGARRGAAGCLGEKRTVAQTPQLASIIFFKSSALLARTFSSLHLADPATGGLGEKRTVAPTTLRAAIFFVQSTC